MAYIQQNNFTAAIWHGTGDILSHFKDTCIDNFAGRSLVHGMVGGGIRAVEGGNFGDGFLAASVAAALPINSIGGAEQSRMMVIAERTTAAGVVGGTVSALTGGNFTNGAKTAAFAELFNDLGEHVLDLNKPLTPSNLSKLEAMDPIRSKPTMTETLYDCSDKLIHDHTFHGLFELSVPISKSYAKERGWINKSGSGSPVTSVLSMLDINLYQNIPEKYTARMKTDNAVFRTLASGSRNILRGTGRIIQRYGISGYAAGYMVSI